MCSSEYVSGFYLLSFVRCCSVWEACGHGALAVTGYPGQHSASAFHKPDPWQSFPAKLMVTGTIPFLVCLVWLGWASQIPDKNYILTKRTRLVSKAISIYYNWVFVVLLFFF